LPVRGEKPVAAYVGSNAVNNTDIIADVGNGTRTRVTTKEKEEE
jgi:hypothetical protein